MTRAVLLAALLYGCGASATGVARDSLRVAASAGAEADDLLSAKVDLYAAGALRQSKTFDEYQGRMTRLAAAVDAVSALRYTLLAAEHALDSWEISGRPGAFWEAMGCVAASVRDVAQTFTDAGLSLPFAIAKAEEVLKGAPVCKGAP